MNFVVQFYLRTRDNKFHIVIYLKVHFVVICNSNFTFSIFYILLCLFSIVFIQKSMEYVMYMKMKCNFFCKIKGEGCSH